jgi:hypothetical protein
MPYACPPHLPSSRKAGLRAGRQGFGRRALCDLIIHYDERRIHYGKTNSMGGIFNNDEGKGEERKEAYLDGLL